MKLDQEIEQKITQIAQEVCDREGYILYDMEYLPNQKIVRIFIDKEPGGISLDECAKVSQGVNLQLDIEDFIISSYHLEVSSPGLERVLKEKWHFEKQIEKEVNAVIKARTETSKSLGKKNIKGILKKVEDDAFTVETEKGKLLKLPYQDIHKCNVVYNF